MLAVLHNICPVIQLWTSYVLPSRYQYLIGFKRAEWMILLTLVLLPHITGCRAISSYFT